MNFVRNCVNDYLDKYGLVYIFYNQNLVILTSHYIIADII